MDLRKNSATFMQDNFDCSSVSRSPGESCENARMMAWFASMKEQLIRVILERHSLQCTPSYSMPTNLEDNALNFEFKPFESPLITVPSPSDALRSLSNSSASFSNETCSISSDYSFRQPNPFFLEQHPLDFRTNTCGLPNLSSTPARINNGPSFDASLEERTNSSISQEYRSDNFSTTSVFSPIQSRRQNQPDNPKVFACKLCPKTYSQTSALKMHIRTHTLPCKCQHCGKSFSRKWLLKGHERTHTGERPYSCPTCGRSFADRSNLRAHMQTHQNDKRYKCSYCPRSFSRMGLLTKHLQQSTCGSLATNIRA